MSERAGSRSGMPRPGTVRPIGAEALVALLEGGLDRVVLIDSRPFVDYNASHILEAVNVNCSKLMKRRLQQDKVQIAELLQHSAKKKVKTEGRTGVHRCVRKQDVSSIHLPNTCRVSDLSSDAQGVVLAFPVPAPYWMW